MGWRVPSWIRYDPEKIDTSEEASVVVRTPDGQDVETPFNLAILR